MKPKNDGGPYHPLILPTKAVNGVVTENNVHPGASLRDHFAGLAMQAHIGMEIYAKGELMPHEVVAHSYEMADAMLAERERGR